MIDLYLSLSVILLGLSFALMYLSALVPLNNYFSRKHSSAMGIAVCGSGVGTLVFPWLMPYVIDNPLWFDFDGGLLLEAGTIFICVIFGALMVKSFDLDVRSSDGSMLRFLFLWN